MPRSLLLPGSRLVVSCSPYMEALGLARVGEPGSSRYRPGGCPARRRGVRGVLLPSAMALPGDRTWHPPRWLCRLSSAGAVTGAIREAWRHADRHGAFW